MTKAKVQVTLRPCPHGCGLELTHVVWPDPLPPSWLEQDNFAVTACPDCGGRLDQHG